MNVFGVYPQGAYRTPTGEKEWLEPLGLEYILTQAGRLGHEVDMATLFDRSEDELIREVISRQPDIVPFSVMTCQVPKALKIASELKAALPQAKIIFGGYHPSATKDTPGLLGHPAVDYWIAGEGEQTFTEILETLEAGHDPKELTIPGLVYMQGNQVIHRPRLRTANLVNFGWAWRDISIIKQLRNYGLAYPETTRQTGWASLEHSRGCLGNCAFCASVGALGCQVAFRSAESVSQEIAWLYGEHGINSFFFADLDFIQRGKENQARVSRLCQMLAKLRLPIYWDCLGRVASVIETGNLHLLNEMYAAGCRKVGWGIESLYPGVAHSMGKGHHGHEDEAVREVLATTERIGILNTGFVVIGWHDFEHGTGDTRESILADAELLLAYPLHRLRVTIGTPLPGSRFYRICKTRGLLTTSNLEEFDTTRLVYRHPSLSPDDLDQLRAHIYHTFYTSPVYQARTASLRHSHPEYNATLDEFLSKLQYQ